MSFNFFEADQKVPKIEDMFSLDCVVDETTLRTKNGEYVKVIGLEGLDYVSKGEDEIDFMRQARQLFFKHLSKEHFVTIHTFKELHKQTPSISNFPSPIISELEKKHNNKFKESYRIKHYIVMRTRSGKINASILGSTKTEDAAVQKRFEELNDLGKKTLVELAVWKPDFLTYDKAKQESSLLSFFSQLLKGSKSEVFTNAHELGAYIGGSDIEFPRPEKGTGFENYMVYNDGQERVYSTWLSILAYPDASTSKILSMLYSLSYNLHTRQSFSPTTKDKALSIIDKRIATTFGFTKYGGEAIDQLTFAAEETEAGNISWGTHGFTVQILSTNKDELDDAAREVKNVLLSGFKVESVRETIHTEALFWANFPDLEHLNVRSKKNMVTNETVADFVTFQADDLGSESCSWGNAPVCHFKTVSGADHGFIFHKSPRQEENGNTIIIGGSGSGKTTLISFLLSQATKFQRNGAKFKVLAFDKSNGLEVPFKLFDCTYTDFDEKCELNPFHLPDNGNNRAFLTSWLKNCTSKNDDESIELISQAIDTAYQLNKKDRKLAALADEFGLKRKGNIRASIDKWLPGGAYGDYFNGDTDALNFDSQMVGFDMTTLLNIPEILGAVTEYVFHGFQTEVSENPCPNAVFFDELVKFLDSPIGHMIPKWPQEIRKLDGIFIGAIQELKVLTNHKYGTELLDNCGTFILYPNPSAEREHYIDALGLSESEFKWIRTPSHYHAMVKRKDGRSTILNVDLSDLGGNLKVLSSARREVSRLRNCIEDGGDWKEKYIGNER